MKNLIIICSALFIVPVFTTAQSGKGNDPKQNKEKIESIRIGFLTKELDLTPEESQRFWPQYNAHKEKEAALIQSLKPTKARETMSEKEAEAELAKRLDGIDKMAALQKEFILSMKTVLPVQKVLRLEMAEREFNRKLMHEIRERHHRRKGS